MSPPAADAQDVVIPPGDPTDTSIPGQYEYDQELPQWQDRDYIEIAICTLGLYVALLGIKSTSEHICLALATRFVVLLGVLGVSWNSYLYYCYVDELKSRETKDDYDSGKVYSDAMFASFLPLMMWLIFFLRAMQFYVLVKEAESDAEERSRSLASAIVSSGGGGDDNGNGNGDGYDESSDRTTRSRSNSTLQQRRGRDEYDLELQVEGRSIT